MILVYLVSILLSFAYVFLITNYMTGWNEIEEQSIPNRYEPKQSIEILIPARNEAANIEACIRSILSNQFPQNLLKITIIDDHSEDDMVEKIGAIGHKNIKIISLKDHSFPKEMMAFKKAGIELAIKQSKANYIVLTDADCALPKTWLRSISYAFKEHNKSMICGPVYFTGDQNIWTRFQQLDSIVMMGINAGGMQSQIHFIGNGANLAFERDLFNAIDPYQDNKHIASGDDMFFIEKLAAKNPDQIQFLKSKQNLVVTSAEEELNSFLNQRKRWATKTKNYSNKSITFTSGLVFLLGLSIIFNLIFGFIFNIFLVFIAITQLFIKAIIDYLFIARIGKFYELKKLERKFPMSFIIYFPYILFMGIQALLPSKTDWKGRQV